MRPLLLNHTFEGAEYCALFILFLFENNKSLTYIKNLFVSLILFYLALL